MKQLLLLIIILFINTNTQVKPPYHGTIFMNPNIVKDSDPSSLISITYTSVKMVKMFDRRKNDWITVNAYLFDVKWNDGLTSRAQVNSEFGNLNTATIEAKKYAFLIGQLPYVLRIGINEIWIQKGTKPFGGGNHSILIHTGQSVIYEKDGIIEETLIHEACHTSLDSIHAKSINWKKSQKDDHHYISTYAKENPIREDIAESFLTWFAIRYRKNRMSSIDYNKITQTIPNRLKYFDSIKSNE
ncbi:hypothetical protein [Thalassobellus citreus]|uniref:hypothetical protein n=1 Tax=Thalassobellus citreus TaxID=3367752 RepID=UPI0037A7F183